MYIIFTLNILNNIYSDHSDHIDLDLQWHAEDFTGCFGSRQHHEHDQSLIMFSAEILIKVFSPFLRYSRLKNTLHLWRNPLGTLSHLAYLHPQSFWYVFMWIYMQKLSAYAPSVKISKNSRKISSPSKCYAGDPLLKCVNTHQLTALRQWFLITFGSFCHRMN